MARLSTRQFVILVALIVGLFLVANIPHFVFHRVLCTTWVKPGHTAVCRGYKGP